jgi:heme-degrading monooxygenase HmoA
MIARTWRGHTRVADAAEYAEYVRRTGFDGYRATPGNRGGLLLYREDGDVAEFLTVSLWESLDAVKAFAGDDVERAMFYPEDDRYLVSRELVANHFVVAGAFGTFDDPDDRP